MTKKEIRKEIAELKRNMRIDSVKTVCCFNGGLDSLTHRYNSKLFELKVKLERA